MPELIKAAAAIVSPCDVDLYKHGKDIYLKQGVRLHYSNIKERQIIKVEAAIRKCGGLLSLEITKDE